MGSCGGKEKIRVEGERTGRFQEREDANPLNHSLCLCVRSAEVFPDGERADEGGIEESEGKNTGELNLLHLVSLPHRLQHTADVFIETDSLITSQRKANVM